MERPKRARRRKPETDQGGPGAAAPQFLEGRVSIARWNPKGMEVCPAKAGVFSGRQPHQGNSQKPCSLDSQEEGN